MSAFYSAFSALMCYEETMQLGFYFSLGEHAKVMDLVSQIRKPFEEAYELTDPLV